MTGDTERCNLGGEIVFIKDMGMAEHDGENGKVRYRVGRIVSEHIERSEEIAA